MQALSRESYAKINLYLEIAGARADGYHDLDSLMAPIDIYDEISVVENDELILQITGENAQFLQQDWSKNIIIKAINLLAEKFNFTPKIKITLKKNIPIAAGLGGGSSNAATILELVNQFYNLGASEEDLLKIGLKLGADVPFFVKNKMAFASGVGEILQEANFDCKNQHILLINPNEKLLTAEVFANFDKKLQKAPQWAKNETGLLGRNLVDFIKNRRNDLESAAIKMEPRIADILQQLKKQQNCHIARMSGSGASCFGIFGQKEDLDVAYLRLKNYFPNYYLQKTKIINNEKHKNT